MGSTSGGSKRRRASSSPLSHAPHHLPCASVSTSSPLVSSSELPAITVATTAVTSDAAAGGEGETSEMILSHNTTSDDPPTAGLAALEAKLLQDIRKGTSTGGGEMDHRGVSTSENTYSALEVEDEEEVLTYDDDNM